MASATLTDADFADAPPATLTDADFEPSPATLTDADFADTAPVSGMGDVRAAEGQMAVQEEAKKQEGVADAFIKQSTPTLWQDINTPLVPQTRVKVRESEPAAAKIVGGLVNAATGLASSLTSPLGVATLGLGAAPKLIQKAAALAFGTHTVKESLPIAVDSTKPLLERSEAVASSLLGGALIAGGGARLPVSGATLAKDLAMTRDLATIHAEILEKGIRGNVVEPAGLTQQIAGDTPETIAARLKEIEDRYGPREEFDPETQRARPARNLTDEESRLLKLQAEQRAKAVEPQTERTVTPDEIQTQNEGQKGRQEVLAEPAPVEPVAEASGTKEATPNEPVATGEAVVEASAAPEIATEKGRAAEDSVPPISTTEQVEPAAPAAEPIHTADSIFGKDAAKYRDLLQKEGDANPEIADAAQADREKMEAALPEDKQAALYGAGPEPPPVFPKGMKMKAKNGGFIDMSIVEDAGRAVWKTVASAAEWTAEMIRRFGAAVKPHLEALSKSLTGQNIRPQFRESGAIGGVGARKFFEEDAKPFVVAGAKNTVTALRQIKAFVAPASMGKIAGETAGIVRQNAAELARSHEIAKESLKSAAKAFDKLGKADSLDFIDRMESGGPQPTPALQAFSDTMRSALDDRLAQVRALGTGKLQQAIANYFPHIWKDPKAAGSFYNQVFGKRPLEGPKSFLKKRSIPTTADGIAAGLEPVTHNPAELALLKLHEIDRYIMGQHIMGEMKDTGIAQFVRAMQKPPDGFVKIDDRVAQVVQLRPTIKADGSVGAPEMIVRGHYYAPEEGARILNNHLSPGLRGVKIYDGFRWLGNTLNQAQLGFSAFHLGMVSIDSAVSKVALGIEHTLSGRPLTGLREAAQAPAAPILNMVRGSKMLREYYKPGSQGADIGAAMDAAMKGGGRARINSFYQTNAWRGFTRALRSGNYIGATLRAPFAALEASMKPILEFAVPRMKLGMFADFARVELERLGPNATLAEQRAAMGKAWDSVDNRMGQLVYDNLFWKKTLKDSLMAGTRSVGWNLGTIRELGGGVADIASTPARLLRAAKGTAKPGEKAVTHRMAYAMALPIVVGIMGAIYQKLHTGQLPGQKDDGTFGSTGDSLKDMFLPRTGKTNAQGEPERVMMPSYMKDVFAYSKHPVQTVKNKANPAIAMVGEMLDNKEYYGSKIVDSQDPLFQKVKDEAKFVASQMVPFSIQGAKHRASDSAGAKIESAVGIVPAPAELTRTPAHQEMMDALLQRIPSGARSREQQARYEMRKEIIAAGKSGKSVSEAISKAGESGVSFSKIQRKNISTAVRSDPRVLMFRHLTIEEAQRVLEVANPEEKELFSPILRAKQRNLKK